MIYDLNIYDYPQPFANEKDANYQKRCEDFFYHKLDIFNKLELEDKEFNRKKYRYTCFQFDYIINNMTENLKQRNLALANYIITDNNKECPQFVKDYKKRLQNNLVQSKIN